ncbi:polyketide synthase dehydratase domain-containing protein, partial [Streptomyces cucumeris]|uniref:polyketide synthase dehydratase domain-containing protein n=1 Tax=Streptomyces cucumeris TaxID=2962890 RepID=UPI003D727488
ISQDTQPWTRDHIVFGMVLVPGAALVEMALTAGRKIGCPVVDELVIESPLLLDEDTALRVQVTVGAADPAGRREVAVFTGPEGDDEPGEATCHARGLLAPDSEPLTPFPAQWPPAEAEPIDVDELYRRVNKHAHLTDAGFDYGPAFRGVRAAWQVGDDVCTELALPEIAGSPRGFAVHPALLDSALHGGLGLLHRPGSPGGLPFSWSGVRLDRTGGTRLRVRIGLADETALRMEIAGEDGTVIARVARMDVRPVERSRLEAAQRSGRRSLHQVGWVDVPAGTVASTDVAVLGELQVPGTPYADLTDLEKAIAGGAAAPQVVVTAVESAAGADPAASARATTLETLTLVQRWLDSAPLGEARLMVVTNKAVGVAADETPDLTQAPVWGLLRSAQSEHPERFALVDSDGSGLSDWS